MSAAASSLAVRPRAEGRLLRRTRWRLIAWSGGSTLAVLLLLGVAIYAAAAASLSASGVTQLQTRLATLLAGAPTGLVMPPQKTFSIGVTTDAAEPGAVIGGPASGTIGFFVDAGVVAPLPTDEKVLSTDQPLQLPIPADAVQEAITSGNAVVREASIGSTPIRVLVAPIVQKQAGTLIGVVVGDRTAEVDTLRTLLLVLLGGGLLVLLAAVAVGWIYAGRALVPIRESLRRQREFAADASHELRTPLAIARAAITELRRSGWDPAVVSRAVDDLDAGTTRLSRLVDDLLLLARTDAETIELQPEPTDLALVAAETLESFEAVARERAVRLRVDVVPAPLNGDVARLRQLVAILVDNAIRHSPPSGLVTVTVRPGSSLVVEDEGRGIAPDHLSRVFERFWRAPDAPAEGTGLGLAIARWIVERHDGSIRAENHSPGHGARFVVTLPERDVPPGAWRRSGVTPRPWR